MEGFVLDFTINIGLEFGRRIKSLDFNLVSYLELVCSRSHCERHTAVGLDFASLHIEDSHMINFVRVESLVCTHCGNEAEACCFACAVNLRCYGTAEVVRGVIAVGHLIKTLGNNARLSVAVTAFGCSCGILDFSAFGTVVLRSLRPVV